MKVNEFQLTIIDLFTEIHVHRHVRNLDVVVMNDYALLYANVTDYVNLYSIRFY